MTKSEKPTSWRDVCPPHPLALRFPRPTDDELRQLENNIRLHGLQLGVTLYKDADGKCWVADGVSRLDAMERLDHPVVSDEGTILPELVYETWDDGDPPTDEPRAYLWARILCLNLHRRHLTASQRRGLTAELLRQSPEKSDRQIAKQVGVHHETVGSARKKLEARGGIRHVEKRTDTKGRQQPALRLAKSDDPLDGLPPAVRTAAMDADTTNRLLIKVIKDAGDEPAQLTKIAEIVKGRAKLAEDAKREKPISSNAIYQEWIRAGARTRERFVEHVADAIDEIRDKQRKVDDLG